MDYWDTLTWKILKNLSIPCDRAVIVLVNESVSRLLPASKQLRSIYHHTIKQSDIFLRKFCFHFLIFALNRAVKYQQKCTGSNVMVSNTVLFHLWCVYFQKDSSLADWGVWYWVFYQMHFHSGLSKAFTVLDASGCMHALLRKRTRSSFTFSPILCFLVG